MTKQQLIEDNINLVYALISREYPTYLHDDDIIQCGMLGLCQAADKWDENKAKFSDFAWYCIRHEIIREFKRRSKYSGTLSLDYEISNEDGVKTPLGDFIVGDEDVPYVDLSVDLSRLNEKELQIYNMLIGGVEPLEIARRLNITHQYVTWTKRKLRLLRGLDARKE